MQDTVRFMAEYLLGQLLSKLDILSLQCIMEHSDQPWHLPKGLSFLHAGIEDSDQNGQILKLI